MKRAKSSESLAGRRWRPAKLLFIAALLYLAFTSVKLLRFFSTDVSPHSSSSLHSRLIQYDQSDHQTLNVELDQNARLSEKEKNSDSSGIQDQTRRLDGYGRITGEILRRYARAYSRSRSRSWIRTGNFSELERVAQEAWVLGHKAGMRRSTTVTMVIVGLLLIQMQRRWSRARLQLGQIKGARQGRMVRE